MRNFVAKWRFAAQRRWFTYLGMAVIFAVACVLLSRWQFGRNEETVAANKLVTHNYDAAACRALGAPAIEVLIRGKV